ncbi:MAG TPA: heparinase II/III family protein, partial [Terriglobia bacterium]|nr:heparinase II/III family protein [Terriglobia bacterium]
MRNDKARIGKGLTVEQLRLRVEDPRYSGWRRGISNEGPSAMVERAAVYLESGQTAELEAVRRFLLTHTYSYAVHDVEGFLAGAEMATAFDWLYSFLSDVDRRSIMANIVKTADSSREFMLQGEPDINHNYTYMALRTLGVCGLVLKGEPEPYNQKATEYLALTKEWIEGQGKILDSWKAREGAWGEGSHYTFHETLRNLVMLFQAYRSATDMDYFIQVEKHYDGFLAKAGMFLVASTRPDLTLERIGDCSPSRVMPTITVPLTLEALAVGLGTSREAARLRSFSSEICDAYGSKALNPAFDWGMRIFLEPPPARKSSYQDYPHFLRIGPGTDERIVFRNGWGVDSTMITIVAGNHYTDHQHFDKGQFLIYHRGGLVVDSGAYDSLNEPNGHWDGYACRTLAHNCLLIYNPQQIEPVGYSNDGGQMVLRGLQHHADWLTYLAHYKKESLDAAKVLAYDADEQSGYAYVRCDLGVAYGPKVTACDRQFLYLPQPDLLVVFDRVKAAQPQFEKRWLLHFQDPPTVDGAQAHTGVQSFVNAQRVQVRRTGQLKLENKIFPYDGVLTVDSLLPELRTVATVGGEGYEFFNSFENLNYRIKMPNNSAAPREVGNWRIEVVPQRQSSEDQFLHAFQIHTTANDRPREVALVRDMQQKVIGAHFKGSEDSEVVLFSTNQKGGPITLPVTYEINSLTPARHLLVEMLSLDRVGIEVNEVTLKAEKVSTHG